MSYSIKNIQIIGLNLIKNKINVNRDLLVTNFDYFNKLVKYNNNDDSCTLDLDLNFVSFELCYYLMSTGSAIVLTNVDYNAIIGILEIFDVLLCTNFDFINRFVFELINKLDNDEPNVVSRFCQRQLCVNNKINPELKDGIEFRMSYVYNPTIYTKIFGASGDDIREQIILIIRPKFLWRILKRESDTVSIQTAFCNWGLAYLNSNDSMDPTVENVYSRKIKIKPVNRGRVRVESIVEFDIISTETENIINQDKAIEDSKLRIYINEDYIPGSKWELTISGIGQKKIPSIADTKILNNNKINCLKRFQCVDKNGESSTTISGGPSCDVSCKYFSPNNIYVLTIVIKGTS